MIIRVCEPNLQRATTKPRADAMYLITDLIEEIGDNMYIKLLSLYSNEMTVHPARTIVSSLECIKIAMTHSEKPFEFSLISPKDHPL